MSMRIDIKLPTRWSDLTPEQLLLFCRLSLRNLTPTEVKCRMAVELAGLKYIKRHFIPDLYEFKKDGIRFTLDADRFADIVSLLDFIESPPEGIAPPARIKSFAAPDCHLYGVVLEQWFLADNYFASFTSSGDIKALNSLVATLYHKPGHKWQLGFDVSGHAARFATVPLHNRHLVYLWYYSVKLWLMQKYFYVFDGSGGQCNVPADELVMATIGALNGGNVANNDKVKLTEVHEALFELNRMIEFSKNKKHV